MRKTIIRSVCLCLGLVSLFLINPASVRSQAPPMPIWECYCKLPVPTGSYECPHYTIVSWVQLAYLDCCINNKLPGTSFVYHPVYDCTGRTIGYGTVYIEPSYISQNCPFCGPPA